MGSVPHDAPQAGWCGLLRLLGLGYELVALEREVGVHGAGFGDLVFYLNLWGMLMKKTKVG